MDCSPPGSFVHGDSPGKNTGVCCHALSQGIFPTQGLSPGLLCCRLILYCLSHQGSPRILEWVAYPFSSGSSRPRNRTGVSCIADGFFTNWAIREAHKPRQQKPRQWHYFADKGKVNQNYVFSSSHVLIWELDNAKNWVLRNWCLQTVMLEDTRETPGLQGDQTSQS